MRQVNKITVSSNKISKGGEKMRKNKNILAILMSLFMVLSMLPASAFAAETVTLDGKSIEMPPKELELLYFLAKRPNQVFTRDQLLDRLWDYEYAGDSRTVDVHIKRLREKLNENHNWSISTVWGKGYKFEVK